MITPRTTNAFPDRSLKALKPAVALLTMAALSAGMTSCRHDGGSTQSLRGVPSIGKKVVETQAPAPKPMDSPTMSRPSGKSPVVTYHLDQDPYFAPTPASSGKNPVESYGKNPVVSYGKNPVAMGKNPIPHSYGKNPIPYGKNPIPSFGKNPPMFLPPAGGPPVKFHFGLDTTVYYDDNIFISEAWEREDVIFRIVPHLGFDIGDVDGGVDSYGIFRYSPTFDIFLDNEGENRVDHDAYAELQFRIQRLTLLAYSRFQKLSDPQEDIGSRFDRNVYTNSLRAIYDVSPKTNIEVGGRNETAKYDGDESLIDYSDWYFDTVLEYVVSEKTRIGAGYGYGMLDVENAADQDYQRGFGRLLWYPSGKLTLEGIAGVDFRDLPIGDRNTFIYDVSLQYNPRQGTAMHLTTYRDVESSARFENQNYDSTGVGFKVDQRVGRRFTAGFQTGYEWSDYYAVTNGPSIDRNDEYWFVRPSLTYAFRDWLSVEFWYRYRDADSSLPGFSYENNQVGISAQMVF